MKYLIGLVFCALLGVGNAVNYCTDADGCEDNECCVATYCTQILGIGLCTTLGRVGSPCNTPGHQLSDHYGKKYLTKCPCRKGLDCEGPEGGTILQNNVALRCKKPGFFAETPNEKNVASDSVNDNNSN